jgi:hypothetical protein
MIFTSALSGFTFFFAVACLELSRSTSANQHVKFSRQKAVPACQFEDSIRNLAIGVVVRVVILALFVRNQYCLQFKGIVSGHTSLILKYGAGQRTVGTLASPPIDMGRARMLDIIAEEEEAAVVLRLDISQVGGMSRGGGWCWDWGQRSW